MTLPSFRTVIRHQWGVISLALLGALLLSWVYVLNLPLTYTSNAVILLSPSPGNPLIGETASGSAMQMTVALETEAQLVHTPAVAQVVEETVGRGMPQEGEVLAVSVPSNTQMLAIDFTAHSPQAARDGAQGFAEGYLTYRQRQAELTQETSADRLTRQIEEADADLRRAVAEAAGDEATAYASQEAQVLADRLARLNSSLSENQALSIYPGSVIVQADTPQRANELSGWILLGTGGVVGLLAGLGLGFLREWRGDFVRDAASVESIGLPTYASINLSETSQYWAGASQDMIEAFRSLRTQVIADGTRPRVIAVSGVVEYSAQVEVGSSARVAAGLAVVLAEAKFSVLLIATPSQDAEVEALMGTTPNGGLSEAVLYPALADELLQRRMGVAVLTAGCDYVHASDLTASESFREIVHTLQSRFDYIVIAASTAGSADGDAALLASDSTLLVMSLGEITRRVLTRLLTRLKRLGISVSGAVIVRRGRAEGHGYRSGRPRRAREKRSASEHAVG